MIQAAHRRWHQGSGKHCVPLLVLVELPQLTVLSLALRRLVDLKPVLMLVNNTSLVCCWVQVGLGSHALWRSPMVSAAATGSRW